MLNFTRNYPTVFQRGCTTVIRTKNKCLRDAFYPCQHLVLSVCFLLVVGLGVSWSLIMASICIFPVVNDVVAVIILGPYASHSSLRAVSGWELGCGGFSAPVSTFICTCIPVTWLLLAAQCSLGWRWEASL